MLPGSFPVKFIAMFRQNLTAYVPPTKLSLSPDHGQIKIKWSLGHKIVSNENVQKIFKK